MGSSTVATTPNNVPTNIGVPGGAPTDPLGISMFLTQFCQAVNNWIAGGSTGLNWLLGNFRPVKVAALPTPTLGARSFVSDATATTFASVVSGGGTNAVPVYADGTHWRIG